ncbi:type II secretion system protein [Fictibacillus sp. 26RED30]|uniref:type II secretion system protein n=1 Tax=Fictibacillus sp. 26RED30 TaxID=2745877 RepID=UPI0018CEBE53|nr:type II secretion system protein [Fictibacillus sp. 26RED30]MBH0159170.1 type II secretion system protein [Fictibacillus sp. 26RED30]
MLKKLLKKYAKNEKGLTLIELLVVIVILGIIAAIAVVSIGGIITNTREKAKVTEAVQIVNAAKLAHSTEGKYSDTGWDQTDLAKYVSNVKDTSWSVTVDNNGVYSINNHDGVPLANTTASATSATEKQLTTYLDEK